jgi:hypothetical protein
MRRPGQQHRQHRRQPGGGQLSQRSLSPSGNNLAPIDGGEPNTSNGPATNQCADLT